MNEIRIEESYIYGVYYDLNLGIWKQMTTRQQMAGWAQPFPLFLLLKLFISSVLLLKLFLVCSFCDHYITHRGWRLLAKYVI